MVNLTGYKVPAVFWAYATLLSIVSLTAIGCGGNGVEVEKRIGPDGGFIESADGLMRLDVPADALDDTQLISLVQTDDFPPVGQVTPVYEFGPESISFSPAALLTIGYDPERVPQGFDESELRLGVFENGWEALQDSVVNGDEHTITASVDGFSQFAAVAQSPSDGVISLASVEARPATSFRMPIGDDGEGSDLGNDLSLLSMGFFASSGYPNIRFNDDGDPIPDGNEWWVSTAFNRDHWLYGGWDSSGQTRCYTECWYHPAEDWNLTGGRESDQGKPVHAIADGVVLLDGWVFGHTVIIVHQVPTSNEFVASVYAHLLTAPGLAVGSPVSKGDIVGEIGMSGPADGPHLHLEIRQDSMLRIDKEGGTIGFDEPNKRTPRTPGYWPMFDTGFIADNYYPPSEFISENRTCEIPAGTGAPSEFERLAFDDAYDSALGCATGTVQVDGFESFAETTGHYQRFNGGTIQHSSRGTFAVAEPLFTKWECLGFESRDPNDPDKVLNPMGYPTSELSEERMSSHGTKFRFQSFEGGSLEWHQSGDFDGKVVEIHGGIINKWISLTHVNHPLGLPLPNPDPVLDRSHPDYCQDEWQALPSQFGTTGRVQRFEDGHIHWMEELERAFETHGAIDDIYLAAEGTRGCLGFPISDQDINASGNPQSDFEDGHITATDGVTYEVLCRGDPTSTLAPTPTPCPVDDVSFCDFVNEIDSGLELGDVSFLVSRTELTERTCGFFRQFEGTSQAFPPAECEGKPDDAVPECVDWNWLGAAHSSIGCLTIERYTEELRSVPYAPLGESDSVSVIGLDYDCAASDCVATLFLRDPAKPLSGDPQFDLGVVLNLIKREGDWTISSGGGYLVFYYYANPDHRWPTGQNS